MVGIIIVEAVFTYIHQHNFIITLKTQNLFITIFREDSGEKISISKWTCFKTGIILWFEIFFTVS